MISAQIHPSRPPSVSRRQSLLSPVVSQWLSFPCSIVLHIENDKGLFANTGPLSFSEFFPTNAHINHCHLIDHLMSAASISGILAPVTAFLPLTMKKGVPFIPILVPISL